VERLQHRLSIPNHSKFPDTLDSSEILDGFDRGLREIFEAMSGQHDLFAHAAPRGFRLAPLTHSRLTPSPSLRNLKWNSRAIEPDAIGVGDVWPRSSHRFGQSVGES
jgi:hypothetical protein